MWVHLWRLNGGLDTHNHQTCPQQINLGKRESGCMSTFVHVKYGNGFKSMVQHTPIAKCMELWTGDLFFSRVLGFRRLVHQAQFSIIRKGFKSYNPSLKYIMPVSQLGIWLYTQHTKLLDTQDTCVSTHWAEGQPYLGPISLLRRWRMRTGVTADTDNKMTTISTHLPTLLSGVQLCQKVL